jgi:hypothetical protein
VEAQEEPTFKLRYPEIAHKMNDRHWRYLTKKSNEREKQETPKYFRNDIFKVLKKEFSAKVL